MTSTSTYSRSCYRCFEIWLARGPAHSFISIPFCMWESARAIQFRNRLFGKKNSDRRPCLSARKWNVIEAAICVKCSRKQRRQQQQQIEKTWCTVTHWYRNLVAHYRFEILFVVSFSICRTRQFSNLKFSVRFSLYDSQANYRELSRIIVIDFKER